MQSCAFFDLDNTLTKGTLLLRFVFSPSNRTWLPLHIVKKILFFSIKTFSLPTKERLRLYALNSLSGMDKTTVAAEWSKYIEENLGDWLIKSTCTALRNHISKGHSVFIISNNFDFITAPISAYLGFDGFSSINTETDPSGAFPSLPSTYRASSINKKEVVHEIAKKKSACLLNSYGYGDSEEDMSFLSQVGTPYLVTKSGELLPLVLENNELLPKQKKL